MAVKPKKKRIRLYGWKDEEKPRPQKMEDRPVSDPRYHTARWTRESRAFREAHPLCAECEKKGLLVPAEVVDHIIPIAICEDFWDQNNWQPLCRKCNMAKGNRDKKIINRNRK